MLNLASPQSRAAPRRGNHRRPGVDSRRRGHWQNARHHLARRAPDRKGRGASDNILAVTFTNKAAREMRHRVAELLPRQRAADGEKPRRPTICTFHSLCVRILRQHIEKLGFKRNFVIYSESEQLGAIKKILSHISNKGEKVDPGAVLAHAQPLQERRRTLRRLLQPKRRRPRAARPQPLPKRAPSLQRRRFRRSDSCLRSVFFPSTPTLLEACQAQLPLRHGR